MIPLMIRLILTGEALPWTHSWCIVVLAHLISYMDEYHGFSTTPANRSAHTNSTSVSEGGVGIVWACARYLRMGRTLLTLCAPTGPPRFRPLIGPNLGFIPPGSRLWTHLECLYLRTCRDSGPGSAPEINMQQSAPPHGTVGIVPDALEVILSR